MDEFEIIKNYFHHATDSMGENVAVGIGDDGAIVKVPDHHRLAVTTDTLVANTHFFKSDPPRAIGHKALAVNLSDLAAMGATPSWITLAITLEEENPLWLNEFCLGLFDLAKDQRVTLIGGDITRGPLSLTITALGLLANSTAPLCRSGARMGDDIYVSGSLGDAAAGLDMIKKINACKDPYQNYLNDSPQKYLIQRLYYPSPRVALGQSLLGVANAAIDISDGLLADLTHILHASNVGAQLILDEIPLSTSLLQTYAITEAQQFALNGGDDYELCFTVSPHHADLLQNIKNVNITKIGVITDSTKLFIKNNDGQLYEASTKGYKHF